MKLLLRNGQSPGDVLMLTAAVRDLHRAYPGRFVTAVQTSCPDLWRHNPYVVPAAEMGTPDRVIDCQYPLVHDSNRQPYHFIHGFAQDLEQKLKLRIPITEFRGDLHLSRREMQPLAPVRNAGHVGPYWVLVAGGKYDYTTKWWNSDAFQAVVDHFAGRITFVQCGQNGHWHPRLHQVINLVGGTSLREFIRLIWGADGVVCPITLAMHLAAAVPRRPGAAALKPCVVIAGGREPPHWEMYPGHQFLHTIGALPCCADGGCWKSRCVPLGDGDPKDQDLCSRPVRVLEHLQIAKCMAMISPRRVIDAVELYCDGESMSAKPSEVHTAPVEIRVRPRGVAVTIGTGRFKELAKFAAKEVSAHTGLETVILGPKHLKDSGLESPLFLKFRIFELLKAENVFYFDADMVCLAPWDPSRWFGHPSIVAVRDRMLGCVLDEAARWGCPPEDYFNGGMFIANREHHARWLKLAESIRFQHPTQLLDQSPLNAARVELGIPLKLLDRRFNWLGFGASSLSHDMPVMMAHKLAPDRTDLNLSYLKGEHELLAPSIEIEESEAALLAGRTFVLSQQSSRGRKLTFREDGTITPFAGPEAEGYWFMHLANGRPTLALCSETQILHQFIETHSGDWISNSAEEVRLVEQGSDRQATVNQRNARKVADRFVDSIPPYPLGRYQGRGIAICAGGRYLPCAWVCIRMLRELGCQLPIELWQLRQTEITESFQAALMELDVRCVNAAHVRQQYPVRHLKGWELKPYAILHSRFEQVLFLDADNVPLVDPEFLFEIPQYKETGAVFWPDFGNLPVDRLIWRICGVKWRDEPEFESGQILVNKRRCWRALQLTMHLNEHSEFYYQHIWGDKETFHMAWRMLNQPYAMTRHRPESLSGAMCQHDFSGRRIFQHRNSAKWSLNGNQHVEGFKREKDCLGFLRELRNHLQNSGEPLSVGSL